MRPTPPLRGKVMTKVIEARGLKKSYHQTHALEDVSFTVEPGRIVGLIGPNGAGKTTALKAILGLTRFDGELRVLGLDPRSQRDELMRNVSFIADVAVLPGWLRVGQALELVAGVHPRFNEARAAQFLRRTDIRMRSRVRELSKGMVTQLHLALILAIDARLLVLDEPTLGLDLLYRRQFYDALLNDYFNEERTILVTTHQVEEVENLFTDVIFINHGRVVLDSSVEQLAERYVQLTVAPDKVAQARALHPFYEREVFGRVVMIFDRQAGLSPAADRREADPGQAAVELAPHGETRTPSIADLFVAKMEAA
jgi:ABC-2 type transport system ATP-binding protein